MFQWKERCVGGKRRGKGGTFLVHSQKEQQGCVALAAFFPFGIEPGGWRRTATLPQLQWGINFLGPHEFWVVKWAHQTRSRLPGAPGKLCSPPKIRFMDDLACLIWF